MASNEETLVNAIEVIWIAFGSEYKLSLLCDDKCLLKKIYTF